MSETASIYGADSVTRMRGPAESKLLENSPRFFCALCLAFA